MKLRRTGGGEGLPEKIDIPMTPMIDMVFQLLVFFIMNFKVVEMEGDFNVKMPLAGTAAANPDTILTNQYTLSLNADEDGNLAGIQLNGNPIGSLKEVRDEIMANMPAAPSADESGPEVELDCSPNLKYGHTVEAITAVSGWVNERGDVVKLIEKIKFAPPKQ